ncbi:cupredoxin domain-containing protein, partial [Candidatus Dojkabacteria bacterium]|nr:cupredoxin domain-containing protein [Candidatus Dojkabacteria bacterium]
GDYQVLQMNASASAYTPSRLTVKAGIPIRWEINDTGTSGCTSAIISRDMFEGQVKLERGLNVVNIAALQPGTYKFSCWMGMVSGTIVAV